MDGFSSSAGHFSSFYSFSGSLFVMHLLAPQLCAPSPHLSCTACGAAAPTTLRLQELSTAGRLRPLFSSCLGRATNQASINPSVTRARTSLLSARGTRIDCLFLVTLSCVCFTTTAAAPPMLAIQWYTVVLILEDAYELLQLWQANPQTVAQGTWWFDRGANAPLAGTLYAALLVFLMLPRIFVLLEPLNRWLLMLNTIHEGIRLVVYSLLFTQHSGATQLNTILLTFMLGNTLLYGRQYYTTMCMLREYSK